MTYKLLIEGFVKFLLISFLVIFQSKSFGDKQYRTSSLKLFNDLRKAEVRLFASSNNIPIRTEINGRIKELYEINAGKPKYKLTHNANAAISTAADSVMNSSLYGNNGNGVVVGIWDGGPVRNTHQEFDSRVNLMDESQYEIDGHATHVAGTIAAAGIDSNAKGCAPMATIHSYDWSSVKAELSSVAATSQNQADKIYISNHSWGLSAGWEGGVFLGYEDFGRYSYEVRLTDDILYDSPYHLAVWSAGNDRNDYNPENINEGDGKYNQNGYDTITGFGLAKNVLTVGAVEDAVFGNQRDLSSATMTDFSSWGPCDDGRIKPDVVGNGTAVYSVYSDNDSDYVIMYGTSMSAPNITGSTALLIDLYSELFNGSQMRASSLKGLIIHTADDLGRTGPDYMYGWGLMNTLAAAYQIQTLYQGQEMRLKEDYLSSFSRRVNTNIVYSSGNEPLKITLCWTDPAGITDIDSDNRSPDLVNDLDMVVLGPGGNYFPYRLSFSNPTALALTDAKNSVDNVEQIFIENPVPGNYTIQVSYDGFLSGFSQYYALLVSGHSTSDIDSDNLPDWWEQSFFGDLSKNGEEDADYDGSNNYTEYVAGTDPNDPTSIFMIDDFTTEAGGYVIIWNALEDRSYRVLKSSDLTFDSFTPISSEIIYPINRYTDVVENVESESFYKVEVIKP